MKKTHKILLSVLLFIGGCATTQDAEKNTIATDDPYEYFNRKMFSFNDKVDDYVAKPISDAYKEITPQPLQTGVYNFFNNLKNVNVIVNDALQAKFSQSAKDASRLTINSTLGLGGLFDVAKHVGLEQNEEDFDQTLAVWGVPQGSYLVLPLVGPSTLRGIPGAAFDTAANPSTYVGVPIQAISLLNTRANAEGSLQFINEAAIDPYIFTRESYLQWRNNLATDGKAKAAYDIDDLDSEPSNTASTKDPAQKSTSLADTSTANETHHSLKLEAETTQPNVVAPSDDSNINHLTKGSKKKRQHSHKRRH
ncbi:MAG: VacJ family lipoprotein [Methylococcales bacterium]